MAKTCASCKTVSESGEGYREISAFTPGIYCPLCYRKEDASRGKRSLIYLASGMAFVGLMLWLTKRFKPGHDTSTEWVTLNVYLALIFQFVVILPHELGHAVSGRLLGLKLFKISAGIGRPLWKGTLWGGKVEINRYPFGGYTISLDDREPGFRLRHWITVACGPLVNLLFVLAVLPVIPRPIRLGTMGEGWDPAKAFVAANLVILFFNLLPRRANSSLGVVMTDGLQLLRTPFLKREDVRRILSLGYLLPASQALEEHRHGDAIRLYREGLQAFPESLVLQHDLSVALFREGKYEEARREFLSLLANPQADSKLRPFCLNNIAAADLQLGRPDLAEEADRCSSEAMVTLAWNPIIRGTRGAALIEIGRLDEGMALALESIEKLEDERAKGVIAVTLAIAYKRKGDEVEGRKYLDRAVKAGVADARMRRARDLYGIAQ
jgi:hypothetical protein